MSSTLRDETFEVPIAVARALAADAPLYATLGATWRATPPHALLTLARGSSDHAAHYVAYLVMARLGRLVTSLPMSLVTLHGAKVRTEGLAALAFSQSGQSPDLVEALQTLRSRGAQTIAWVNDVDSPLAHAAEQLLPLHAGPERSIAATKSFVAQCVAGARLVAAWQDDAALTTALHALPEALQRALASQAAWCDAALPVLRDVERCYVVGRGLGLAIALEAALKLKEVCGLQAEALSGAELRHGPMALIEPGFPVLVFAPRGPAQAGLLALADELRVRGARVLLAAPGAGLPLVESAEPDLDPIAAVAPFYAMVEALARARGRDPDRPPHLAKVTRTR